MFDKVPDGLSATGCLELWSEEDGAPPGSPVFVGAYFRGAGVGRGFRFHFLRRMSQIWCLLGSRNTVAEGTKRQVAQVIQET